MTLVNKNLASLCKKQPTPSRFSGQVRLTVCRGFTNPRRAAGGRSRWIGKSSGGNQAE
ncbi:hypothetical protein H8E77_10850 [bacterium]|nr:hypothetical protein [bacterium]